MFSSWFSCVWKVKSSMPRWVIMRTLRACCKRGFHLLEVGHLDVDVGQARVGDVVGAGGGRGT